MRPQYYIVLCPRPATELRAYLTKMGVRSTSSQQAPLEPVFGEEDGVPPTYTVSVLPDHRLGLSITNRDPYPVHVHIVVVGAMGTARQSIVRRLPTDPGKLVSDQMHTIGHGETYTVVRYLRDVQSPGDKLVIADSQGELGVKFDDQEHPGVGTHVEFWVSTGQSTPFLAAVLTFNMWKLN